jgi:hypothetical protein
MCLGFVRNYKEFMAVRAILGITEGGLLPGMVSRSFPHLMSIRVTLLGIVSLGHVHSGRDGFKIGLVLHCSIA